MVSHIRPYKDLRLELWHWKSPLACLFLNNLTLSSLEVTNPDLLLSVLTSHSGGTCACLTAGRLAAVDPSLKILVGDIVVFRLTLMRLYPRSSKQEITLVISQFTPSPHAIFIIWSPPDQRCSST